MNNKIENLIIKYFSKVASFDELIELTEWISDETNSQLFSDFVKVNFLIDVNMCDFDTEIEKKKILKQIKVIEKNRRFDKIGYVFKYAAILIIAIGISYVFFKDYTSSPETKIVSTEQKTKIKPGEDKAMLTLEDGSDVFLGVGASYQTQNVKSNGEEIVYKPSKQKTKQVEYNYLTVPRGGQFFITLADGTQVWLNSESQLKYPVNFVEGESRIVELVYGEAYFDVSPSSNHKGSKFKVFNKSQEIEVIGTEFNVKAYKDENNIYTTLVKGKVTMNFENKSQNLIPKQQSNFNTITGDLEVKMVDVYNEISWKDGIFSFEEVSLKEIMKVLSRWYDIEVVFENKNIENKEFIGLLRKDQNIEKIISRIKHFGVIKDYEFKDKILLLK
ncbi:FecR family protein [Seonamhaeicola sp. NFXS20]|uniref:FecR family protein n=1 Tax=Seonamhaeicola sp. NFXS20 TaxID=2816959 RepID=UPI003B8B1947